MPTNPFKPVKLEMTAQQVSAWCTGRQLIRKVFFPKEDKGIALMRPMLDYYYVLEHDHKSKEFFIHYKGKDIKQAVETYLYFLCLYA